MKGVKNYLKNVTKSTIYYASDIAKEELMPNVGDFATTNADFIKAAYSTLRNPKTAVKKVVDEVANSKVYEALDYGAKNLFEDLKTGNFYNKERQERDTGKFAGLDASDFQDLSEFGIDDDWEENLGKDDEDVTAGDLKIVEAVEESNKALASSTANAVISSANATIKNQRIGTGVLYQQNEKLFGGLHNDISILNATMDTMLKLQTTTFQNIDKNLSDYFSESIKYQEENNAILKEMVEMQRNQYKSAQQLEDEARKDKTRGKRYSDVTSGGIPDFAEYFENIQANIYKKIKESTNMPDLSANGEGNMFKEFLVNPMEWIVKPIISSAIPNIVKQSTQELDKTITGLFGQAMARLTNAKNDNPDDIFGKLANFLGVRTSVNKNIDTGKYHKGPVPFDGVTRKAIIEVIPAYLRRIEAALSGRPETMYDYDSGKWVSPKDIKREFDDIHKNAVRQGTSELRSGMQKYIKQERTGIGAKGGVDAQKEFDKAAEEFWEFLHERGGQFNPAKSADDNKIDSKYTYLRKHYEIFRRMYTNFDMDTSGNKARHTNLSSRIGLANAIMAAKDSEERTYRNLENGSNKFTQYFANGGKFDQHGKWRGDNKDKWEANSMGLLAAVDDKGNNVFNYLQNISKELEWQRTFMSATNANNIRFGSGGNGIGGNIRDKNFIGPMPAPIALPDFNKIDVKRFNAKDLDKSSLNKDEKALKDAIKLIAEGKTINWATYEGDTEADAKLLDELAYRIQQQSTEDQKKIKNAARDENFITRIVNKKYETNKDAKKLEEEIENIVKETVEEKANEEYEKEDSIFSRVMNQANKAKNFFSGLAQAPGEIFADVLYSADRAIYDMLFKNALKEDGEEPEEYEGFMDMLQKKTSKLFNNLGESLQDKFINPLKEKLGIGDDFGDKTKDAIKKLGTDIMGKVVEANKEVYTPAVEYLNQQFGLDQKINKVKTEIYKASPDYKMTFKSGNKSLSQNELRQKFVDKKEKQTKIDEYNTDAKLDGRLSYGAVKYNSVKAASNRKSSAVIIQQAERMGLPIGNEQDLIAVLLGEKEFIGPDYTRTKKVFFKPEELDKVRQSCFTKDGKFDELAFFNAVSKRFLRDYNANHAKGTIASIPFKGATMLSKGEMLFNSKGVGVVDKTDAYNLTEPTHILSSYDSNPLLKSMGINPGARRTPEQDLRSENSLKDKLFGKGAGIANHADGSTVRVNGNGSGIDYDLIKENLKQYAPEGIAGGIVGGIVSTLFGVVGGPLVGAAVGAAGNIISNSDSLKDKLFGPLGDDNKRHGGGLISKNIMDTINKYVPDALKYGMAGIIPGLITPLGPLGGILVGSAIGVLKNNEAFTDKYFGEEGKLSFSDETKKTIKDLLPGAAKGAAVGSVATLLFGGPFGLLGNAALGAGVGMVTSTEEFKNMILGEEKNGVRSGGLIGDLKLGFKPFADLGTDIKNKFFEVIDKEIASPLKKFIEPAVARIPRLVTFLPRVIDNAFEATFKRSIGDVIREKITDPIAGVAQKFINSKFIGGAIHALNPLTYLGKLGNAWRKNDIKNGNADYMSGSDIIGFKEQYNADPKHLKKMDITQFDYMRENIEKGNNLDKAQEYVNKITELTSSNDELKKSVLKNKKSAESLIRGDISINGSNVKLDVGTQKAINKILNGNGNNKMERVATFLSQDRNLTKANGGRSLTELELTNLLGGEDGLLGKIGEHDRLNKIYKESMNNKNKDSELAQTYEQLSKLTGMKVNGKNINKVRKALESSIKEGKIFKDAKKTDETPEELQLEENKRTNDKLDKLIELTEQNVELQEESILGNIGMGKDLMDSKNDHYNKAMDIINDTAQYKHSQGVNANIMRLSEEGYTDTQIERISRKHKEIINSVEDSTTSNSYRGPFDIINKGNAIGKALKDGTISLRQAKVITTDKTIDIIRKLKNKKWVINKDDVKLIQYIDKIASHKSEYSKFAIIYNLSTTYTSGRKLTIEDIDYILKCDKNKIRLLNSKIKEMKKAGMKIDTMKSLEQINSYSSNDINTAGALNQSLNIYSNDSEESIPNTQPAVATNGLGTFIKGAARGIGKGIKSLFGNREEGGNNKAAGALASLFAAKSAANSNSGSDTEMGGNNVVREDGRTMKMKEDSNGSLVPDTADSNTKQTLNLISIKEKAQEKLQEAQLKASETIEKIFNPPEGKKKKLNWLAVAISGAALVKSGMLKKVFDNVIKPIWDDKLKPWIEEKAIPWLRDEALPAVTGAISDIVSALGNIGSNIFNWAVEHADKLGEMMGKALSTTINTLWNNRGKLFNGACKFLENLFDYNKDNSGTEKDGNTADIKDDVKFYDKNGNVLNKEQAIAAGTVLNKNGDTITFNDDGTFHLKDGSDPNADTKRVVGNSMLHVASNQALGLGVVNTKSLNAANSINKFLIKRGGIPGKIVGTAGKAIMAPANVTKSIVDGSAVKNVTDKINSIKNSKIGTKIGDFFSTESQYQKLMNSGKLQFDNAAGWVAEDGTRVISKEAFEESTKGMTRQAKKAAKKGITIADDGIKAGGKARNAIKNVAEKGKNWVKKIVDNIPQFIDNILSNSTVGNYLKKAAKFLHVDDVAGWVVTFKDRVVNIFKEATEQAAKKVGDKGLKESAGKVLKVVGKAAGIILYIADFISGADKAESILGVSDTSILEELACGLTNLVVNFIFPLAIFPGVNKIARLIVGFFDKTLEERQAQAQAEFDKYQEEHPEENLTIDEYLEQEKSFGGKIKSKVKEGWQTVKDSAKGGFKGIKTGLKRTGKFIKNAFSRDENGNLNIVENIKNSEFVNKTTDLINKAKETLGSIGSALTAPMNLLAEGKFKEYFTFSSEGDKDNPFGFIKTAATASSRLMLFIPNMVGAIGKNVMGVIEARTGGLANIIKTGFNSFKESAKLISEGRFGEYFTFKSSGIDESNPLSKFGAIITATNRIVGLPINLITGGVKCIADNFDTILDEGKGLVSTIWGELTGNGADVLANGDLLEYFTMPDVGQGYGLSGLHKIIVGTSRVLLFPANALGSAVKSIARNWDNIIDGCKSLFGNGLIQSITTDAMNTLADGDLGSYFDISDPDGDDTNQFSGIRKAMIGAGRVLAFPYNAIGSLGKNVFGAIKDAFSSIGKSAAAYSEAHEKVWSYLSSDKSTKDMDNDQSLVINTGSIMDSFFNSLLFIPATIVRIVSPILNMGAKIKDAIGDVLDKAGEGWNSFWSKLRGDDDEETEYGTGKYGRSKFGRAKQIDPRIANIRFNAPGDTACQTIGDSGCGPAAAVTAVQSMYGRSTDPTVQAANFAVKNGYKEKDGGTKPGFFTDYFNRNGLGSSTYTNRSDMEASIRSGNPTVLMGQDKGGVNSSNPYGKNPHYVTATGVDGRGNVIIQDPESKYDDQVYKMSDVLNKSSLGISTYGKGKNYVRASRFGRGKDIASQVWGYLKSKQFSDESAAGIMGNLKAESGMNPTSIQNGGKGPAAGICQWESYTAKNGRWKNLYNYAKSHNREWTDLAIQLDFMMTELDSCLKTYSGKGYPKHPYSQYPSTEVGWGKKMDLTKYKALTNVMDAVKIFSQCFERPGIPHMDNRIKYAKEYLKQFAGKEGTAIESEDTTGEGDNNASSASNSFVGILSDMISNSTAAKALGLLTGANSSSSSSSSSNSSSDSDDSGYVAGGDAKSVVDIALKEVGTKEKPMGSNSIKYNDWYYGKKVSGSSYPWCSAFVSWVANKAGIPKDVIPKTASAYQMYNGVKKSGGKEITDISKAQPGDIAIFGTDKSTHTGLVQDFSNNQLHTVEGNSSDQVIKRTYAKGQRAVTLVRPNYSTNSATDSTKSKSSGGYAKVSEFGDYSALGGNGNKPISKYGTYKGSRADYVSLNSDNRRANKSYSTNNEYSNQSSQYGMAARNNNTNKLIETVIEILMTIADNTDKLNTIVSILNDKLGIDVSKELNNKDLTKDTKKKKLRQSLMNQTQANSDIDAQSINFILSSMNALASE